MSLPHALLTSLSERAGSGSELARRFDKSIGFFWAATHQQIYRELARLEQAGWIESLPAETGRGRKRAYRVLPAGTAELRRWVAEGEDPRPQRDALMVRIRAEAAIGPAGLADEMRRHLALHEAKLALYKSFEQRDFASDSDSRERKLQYVLLKGGIAQEELAIKMASEAIEILNSCK
ncbi:MULTISPECIES: PadR family transcriptional regulator [unclassified Duganella]|uniref:PadR family transcriptional regulator n=1 Tax=unclassified Duganella TaxID=2636909 RepID=UPI0006F7C14B|nr:MULTISPECIES: PadR family transcriptional regulator [unclassified Duganella]KQV43117.1 PadR family transcriptional regulator [Duganella sp. Root336D2]KRB97243.1 PadR family transcriptional regulator [Duganella sp. Root198D2]